MEIKVVNQYLHFQEECNMGQIASPFEGKKPDYIDKESGKALYGLTREEQIVEYKPIDPDRPERGIMAEATTMTVLEDGETVDLKTGKSDSKYWQPEKVFDPTGCIHVFQIIDVGKREIECTKTCGWVRDFHPGVNFKEENGRMFLIDKGVRYQILPINSPLG